ncbi:hypothetical protein [Curtobacterium citreum]|uniref:hypothetical protein n=1 Tax=Curtobacterium citreum TaxID=2036 RepID=UPI000736615D|nr:hypothetical protein [Curtobacterium citreum]KTR11067.1 hypothetical protein NS330_12965 [Curtobacterium citreum]
MGLIAGYQTSSDINTPTLIEAEATRLQRQFDPELAAIRADTGTSQDGKRVLIAAAWAPVADRVAALQRQQQQEYEAAVARLERKMYGQIDSSDSSAIVGTRDAFDRVEKMAQELPPNGPLSAERQAKQLLDRALKTGDQPLVRAIIATAMSRGWNDLIGSFVATHSDLGDAVADMIELRKWDPSVSLMAYYTFNFPAPTEIAGVTPERAHQIADGSGGPRPYTGEIPAWLRR